MRKCGKFVLLLLLVIMTIAVLAACNGEEGAQTGVNGNTPGGGTPGKEEIVTKPYGLWFDVSNEGTFSVGEFDLATDVVGYVLMQTGSASPIVSTETRFTLTSDMIAEEDRDKLNGPYDGKINVTYTYKDTTLTGFFNITIKAPQATLVDVTVKLGDGASMRGDGATETETPGVWTIKLTEGESYTYSYFVTRFFVSAPEGKAIDHYTYGDGTVFGAGNSLTVTAGMTLEAVYTSTVVDVVYDLNAPGDAWAEGSAPTAPEPERVSVNGYLAGAGNVQRYASDRYTFIGWFTEKYELDGAYDPTAKWNTNKQFKDQSDVRDTLYLYGMWLTKSATVSFDLAARFYSQDPATRTNGGQMADPNTGSSYFEIDQLKPEDYNAIKNLKEGEISEPFESRDNEGRSGNTVYKIIRLDKIIPSHTASFTNDYTMLMEQAKNELSMKAIDDFINEKLATTYIVIDPLFRECTFDYDGWYSKFRETE